MGRGRGRIRIRLKTHTRGSRQEGEGEGVVLGEEGDIIHTHIQEIDHLE